MGTDIQGPTIIFEDNQQIININNVNIKITLTT